MRQVAAPQIVQLTRRLDKARLKAQPLLTWSGERHLEVRDETWASLDAQVSLVGLEILDAQGEPMADAWISSASGTTYANLFGAAAAPEPGTLALCGIALAAGGVLRRRSEGSIPRKRRR